MEGGKGGMDLYFSQFENGQWSTPQNLGPEINTTGNEVFPCITEDDKLYFSSDSRGGVGGLDLYSVVKNKDQEWGIPENMGYPFNSPKDDFGLTLAPDGKTGLFSSSRKSGTGKDDIYHFVISDVIPRLKVNVVASDIETGDTLENVVYKLLERIEPIQSSLNNTALLSTADYIIRGDFSNIGKRGNMRSGKRRANTIKYGCGEYAVYRKGVRTHGHRENSSDFVNRDDHLNSGDRGARYNVARVSLEYGREFTIVAAKEGYETMETVLLTADLMNLSTYNLQIQMQEKKCRVVAGKVYNNVYGNTLPDVAVTLINQCDGEEKRIRSDAKGEFNFPCLDRDCGYELRTEKSNFEPNTVSFSTFSDACSMDTVAFQTIRMHPDTHLMSGFKVKGELLSPNTPLYEFANKNIRDIEVGEVVELNNVFFDFNCSNINDLAAFDLDVLVGVLIKNPTMIIALSSHTDSHGKSKYNDWLSNKRAESAKIYLKDRGIDSERVHFVGCGETKLRNHCSDGIDCSKKEHQFNQRMEVRIVHK